MTFLGYLTKSYNMRSFLNKILIFVSNCLASKSGPELVHDNLPGCPQKIHQFPNASSTYTCKIWNICSRTTFCSQIQDALFSGIGSSSTLQLYTLLRKWEMFVQSHTKYGHHDFSLPAWSWNCVDFSETMKSSPPSQGRGLTFSYQQMN